MANLILILSLVRCAFGISSVDNYKAVADDKNTFLLSSVYDAMRSNLEYVPFGPPVVRVAADTRYKRSAKHPTYDNNLYWNYDNSELKEWEPSQIPTDKHEMPCTHYHREEDHHFNYKSLGLHHPYKSKHHLMEHLAPLLQTVATVLRWGISIALALLIPFFLLKALALSLKILLALKTVAFGNGILFTLLYRFLKGYFAAKNRSRDPSIGPIDRDDLLHGVQSNANNEAQLMAILDFVTTNNKDW